MIQIQVQRVGKIPLSPYLRKAPLVLLELYHEKQAIQPMKKLSVT